MSCSCAGVVQQASTGWCGAAAVDWRQGWQLEGLGPAALRRHLERCPPTHRYNSRQRCQHDVQFVDAFFWAAPEGRSRFLTPATTAQQQCISVVAETNSCYDFCMLPAANHACLSLCLFAFVSSSSRGSHCAAACGLPPALEHLCAECVCSGSGGPHLPGLRLHHTHL